MGLQPFSTHSVLICRLLLSHHQKMMMAVHVRSAAGVAIAVGDKLKKMSTNANAGKIFDWSRKQLLLDQLTVAVNVQYENSFF
mmetsp:Transcript_16702/g.30238  ORF Transcript_16702/g.30238 Transcript_16702/m.30238 type:complete len:83 (+) Transcript_16702:487-735(+)